MAGNDGGPHVQLAVFAEQFIRGAQSGNLSVINIIDAIGVAGPDPNEMPSVSLANFKIIINLWADKTKGRYNIKLRPQEPSGLYGDDIDLGPVNFTPTALGVDIIRQMPNYEVSEEGTYWFDVLLVPPGEDEGQVLTRMPFTVRYQPGVMIQMPGGPTS